MRSLRQPLLLILAIGFATPLQAATPRDELLRLVPEDVGFCLVVQDLRGHWATLSGSPFAAELKKSSAGQALKNAPEWAQLAEIEKLLREHLGMGWAELRDDIFGDAIVLAYRPGPPGKPEQEQGLLLVRARTAEVLAKTVARFNEAQRELGELKRLEERTHRGVKYYYRVEQNHAPYFYCIDGPVLAASMQEEMLKQAIDRGKLPAGDVALAKPFRQLGAEQALLALWLNPRAFEAEMTLRAASASPNDAAFIKNLLVYWKAIDDIVVAITPKQELEVSLGLRARPEALSPAARKLFAEWSRPSELWNIVPGNRAMLVVATRIDLPSWVDAFFEFLPEESRKALDQAVGLRSMFGKIYRDLLAQLGPDAGFAILAPAAAEKQWTPHLLWALKVRPPVGGTTAQNVLDGLNFLAGLAVLDYNSKHEDRLTLKSEPDGDSDIKYFDHDKLYPPGWRPAYALRKNFLLFASSPEVIRGFTNAGTREPPAGETPIFYASLANLRSYITERRDALIGHTAEQEHVSKEQAAFQVDSLLASLHFLDKIELTQRTSTGQVILTLRIKASQPLRK